MANPKVLVVDDDPGILQLISIRLEAMGYDASCNALNSVGYVEMTAFRQGHMTWQEALERFKRNTRRYAKRQMTWFRADRRIRWLPGLKRLKFLLDINAWTASFLLPG